MKLAHTTTNPLGQPGMRKVKVTILPDGTLPTGSPTANCSEAKEPGAKWVKRKTKTEYSVIVVVSHEEQSRRYDMYERREREWKARMLALPRPAPLIDLPGTAVGPAIAKPARHTELRAMCSTYSRALETMQEERYGTRTYSAE